MPAPTVVAVGTVSAVAAVANTVSLPAGAVAGDLLYLIDQRSDAGPSITGSGGGTWTLDATGAAGTSRITAWYSRMVGGQTAPTILASADHSLAVMLKIGGAVGSGSPFDVTGVNYSPNFAETTSPCTGLTTVTGQGLILIVIGTSGPDADANPATEFSGSNPNLSSFTEILDVTSSVGVGAAIGIYAGVLTTPGATGLTTILHSNFRPVARTVAFKAAVVDAVTGAIATPVFPTAAGPGVVPIVAAAAGAGVVPVRTVGAMAAGVVPVIVSAAGVGVVPTIETP